jgi:hypothetical protein
MALGLLRSDRHYYHRSRLSLPLWAKCEATLLQEQGDDVAAFLARGLKPCPACFKD